MSGADRLIAAVIGGALVGGIAVGLNSLNNKADTAVEKVVELRDEHDRLCMMYGLFGPLEGDEEINPKMFPLCRRVYTQTIYIDGVPSGKTKKEE